MALRKALGVGGIDLNILATIRTACM